MCFGITLLFPDVIEIQTAGNPNISSIKKQELKVEIGLSYEEYRQTSNGQAYWGTCKNVSGVPAIVTNSWNPMTITESQNVQGTVSNSSWEYKSVGEEHSTSSEGEYIFILFKFNLHELGDLRSNIAELKVDITAQAGGNNVLDGWQVYFSYSNNTYDWGWMQQPTEELSSQNATHQFAQPIQKESLESFLVPTAGGFDLFYFLIVSKGTQNNDDAVTIRVDSVFVQARIFKPSPPLFRYCSWILQFFIGQDISYITNEPVREAIWIYGGETFRILLGSLILSLAIGIPTGVIAIIYESPLLNKVIRVTTVLGLSLPLVWLAAVPWYALIPSSPGPGGSYPTPLGILIKSILSIIIPGILGASITADLARSLMLELKNQGKPNSKSLLKELFISKKALEQSIVLIILFLFSSVGMYLLEWIFAIEIMFNIPGIFRIFIYAVITGDIYLGLGIFVVCSIVVLSTIFVIDISYTYLDPQITRIFYRAIYLNPRIRYIPLFRICLLKLGQKKCISSANLWQRFRHHKLGMIGLAMLLIVGFFALTADFLSPYAWKYPEMSEDDGPTPIRGYNVYSLTSAADTNIFDYADPPFNLERTGQIAPDSVHFAVESDAVVPEDSAHTRFIYGICPFNVLPILEGVDFNVSLHLDEVQCVGLNERRFMVQVEVNRNVIGNWTLEDRDKI
ncbi:MAG: ABC transporter permease subunit, partial [Candidatus Hodarchaeota archaeon]